MDGYTTLRPGESIRELAERVFEVHDAEERKAAEKALRDANPLLSAEERPAGLIVEVPDTKALEPSADAEPLPAATGAALLRTVRDGVDPYADALRDSQRERERDLRRALKDAKGEEREWVKAAQAEEEARAAELPQAVRQMKADMDALLKEIFG